MVKPIRSGPGSVLEYFIRGRNDILYYTVGGNVIRIYILMGTLLEVTKMGKTRELASFALKRVVVFSGSFQSRKV